MLEYWSTGVLECWSIGVLEYWSTGVQEHFTDKAREDLKSNWRSAGGAEKFRRQSTLRLRMFEENERSRILQLLNSCNSPSAD